MNVAKVKSVTIFGFLRHLKGENLAALVLTSILHAMRYQVAIVFLSCVLLKTQQQKFLIFFERKHLIFCLKFKYA